MIFKHQLKRGKGILNRGERCLFRSVEATYLGSFKSEDDVHWNHMLLMQSVMAGEPVLIEEFIVTTTDARQIIFKAMEEPVIEGQMQLC